MEQYSKGKADRTPTTRETAMGNDKGKHSQECDKVFAASHGVKVARNCPVCGLNQPNPQPEGWCPKGAK